MADLDLPTVPLREVTNVQFGIPSASEIVRIIVILIYLHKLDTAICRWWKWNCLCRTTQDAKPNKGGLMDPRQGPFDKYSYRQTYAGGVAECHGHFGHINLARPVYHIGFK